MLASEVDLMMAGVDVMKFRPRTAQSMKIMMIGPRYEAFLAWDLLALSRRSVLRRFGLEPLGDAGVHKVEKGSHPSRYLAS